MYLWLKALHIIAVISWMAGMLYLPRLFVYHAGAKSGSEQSETFKVMERRLLKFIMTPAMIVTWLLGIVLVLQGQWLRRQLVSRQVRAGPCHDHPARACSRQWVREFAFDRNRARRNSIVLSMRYRQS